MQTLMSAVLGWPLAWQTHTVQTLWEATLASATPAMSSAEIHA